MNKKLIWGIVIVVVILVGAWYVFGGQPSFDGKNMPPLKIDSGLISSDWKIYTNTNYGFTLQYPPTWTLSGVEESPLPNYERASLSFRNFYSGMVLFSVVLNKDGGYTITNPTPYTIPEESKAAYETVLTTIKLIPRTPEVPPVVSIISIKPISGPIGTTVTINGSGFVEGKTNVAISESGRKAWDLISVSANQVTFKIPNDLPIGKHSIMVFLSEKFTPTSNQVEFTVTK